MDNRGGPTNRVVLDGGAIVNYNVVNQKLTNVSFINNSSISNGSGTIFNTSTSTIEIVNALFYGNTGASVAGCCFSITRCG